MSFKEDFQGRYSGSYGGEVTKTDVSQYARIGTTTPVGMVVTSKDGKIIYANDAIAILISALRVELIGRDFGDLFIEGQALNQNLHQNLVLVTKSAPLRCNVTTIPQKEERNTIYFIAKSEAMTSQYSEEDEKKLAELSKREKEVLDQVLRGLRVNGVAEALNISRHTVRNHLKAIYRKLDVHSQVELLSRFWK